MYFRFQAGQVSKEQYNVMASTVKRLKKVAKNNYEIKVAGEAKNDPKGFFQVVFVIISSMSHFSMGSTLTWPSPALSDLALNNITLVGTELVLTPAQIDMTE
ncbi:hypothetical protein GWK47_045587 [Chionoecetes opilio]|uniref:Uncharacterized protein n=1 Tax=Chionoecetes opilio TaxID=41210 RepID=A0A8J4YFC8_CHIOP|nr:hypothetical protein GWK47_045587 [Chionoecetes opilio]